MGLRSGSSAAQPRPDPRRTNYGSYVFFADPDGNEWAVQEVGHASDG